MSVAGGKNAMRMRMARIFSDCENQLGHCFVEIPPEEMRCADNPQRRAHSGPGTKAQRDLRMPDRRVELGRVCPIPEIAADLPASRETRVERERAVDQPQHGTDVLTEKGQRDGGVHQDARIVAARSQGSPCEVCALEAVRLRVLASTVNNQPKTADRGHG